MAGCRLPCNVPFAAWTALRPPMKSWHARSGAQPAPLALQPKPALNHPAAKGDHNQESPDVIKDTWKWCQNLLAGWRDLRAPAAGGKLTVSDDIWQQRAIEAERRAEQALAAARADLAPHLAQALKEALVQELASQRKELLQAQQIATGGNCPVDAPPG